LPNVVPSTHVAPSIDWQLIYLGTEIGYENSVLWLLYSAYILDPMTPRSLEMSEKILIQLPVSYIQGVPEICI